MIFMPPRHGKSELATRRWPARLMGLCPEYTVISASYNSDLAGDFGREVRNIIASPEHQAVYPGSGLAQDSQASDRWHTKQGGSYVSAGVGTAITGRGADVFIIDDPIKGRKDADSELIRKRTWDWYVADVYSRLAPDGAIVLIQTRWHQADLAGLLLEAQEQGGDKWEVLSLPAISADGEALWPEAYSLSRLERIRDVVPTRDWISLYQQAPAPDEGNFFKREDIRWYDERPKHLQVYGASDYAVTADDGDYTVHGVFGVDPDDNLYVLDWWREQATSDVWVEALLDLAAKWKPLNWAEESGQIIKSLGPFISKRMRERRVYFAREQFHSASDKPTRAQGIRGRMAMGKVYLPRHASWVPALQAEMMMFPAGANDDQVDVLSLLGRMMGDMVGGSEPPPPPEDEDPWDRAFGMKPAGIDWKTV